VLFFVVTCALLGGTAAVSLPPLLVVPAAAQTAQSGQPGTTLGTTSADPLAALGDRFEAIARQVAPAALALTPVSPPTVLHTRPGATPQAPPNPARSRSPSPAPSPTPPITRATSP